MGVPMVRTQQVWRQSWSVLMVPYAERIVIRSHRRWS